MNYIGLAGKKFGNLIATDETKIKDGRTYVLCNYICGGSRYVRDDELKHAKTCGCKQKENLSGQKFGLLTVKEYVRTKGWKCICTCGKITYCPTHALKIGARTSCGCKKNNHIDLTNKRFNDLTALRYLGDRKWECYCHACGGKTIYYARQLYTLSVKTCGCKHRIYEDLTGKTFGYLTPIKYYGSTKKESKWLCKCNCKSPNCLKQVMVRANDLKQGAVKYCGCESINLDLTGKQINELLVIGKVKKCDRPKNGLHNYWYCKCLRCGNVIKVDSFTLKSRQIYSCGCIRSRGEYRINKILNEYGIKYESQKGFDDCKGKNRRLKFDFYLPDDNICIEFNGRQHYMVVEHFGGLEGLRIRKSYDKIKRNYCKKHNIRLIEIPFTYNTELKIRNFLIEKGVIEEKKKPL